MVDAVAEPHLLEVLLEGFVVLGGLVAVVRGINCLEQGADLEVVAAVLVPNDVSPGLCCLAEIVDHELLVERELVEVGYLVAEDFDVGEVVDVIGELGGFQGLRGLFSGCLAECWHCHGGASQQGYEHFLHDV